MNKISKHIVSLVILSFLVLPVFALNVHAQVDASDPYGIDTVNTGLAGSLSQANPTDVVVRIINVALGFLGLIAVAIILLGGFKWMTAGGNE